VSENLAKFVIFVVVVAWFCTTVVLPIAVHDYSPPPTVNTVMGIVAGGAVAFLFAKRGDKNGNGKNGEGKA
jgi:uncharacterized membrane protein YccC